MRTWTLNLVFGGAMGLLLAAVFAEYSSRAFYVLFHDKAFWRDVFGGHPNTFTNISRQILWAFLFAGAWRMLWLFDAFFRPLPVKVSDEDEMDDEAVRRHGPTDETKRKEEPEEEEAEEERDPEEEGHAHTLGLQGSYSPADVKRTYRTLIAQYHPDKVRVLGDEIREVAERKAKEINEAYEFFRNKYGL